MATKLKRKHVEAALRSVIAEIDYDTHKQLESDEETGEDTYGLWAKRFSKAYAKSASVAEAQSEPHPSFIVVFCDECGKQVGADYLVRETDSSEIRLGYARTSMAEKGWYIRPGIDLCPSCALLVPASRNE